MSDSDKDINKHESHHDIDPILRLLGPHGNPHKSKTGEGTLNLMREHNLRAASTFFDNNRKYNTWLGLPNPLTGKRKAYQLDHIFIPCQQLGQTTNVKRKFNGATSDHAALLIKFQIPIHPLQKSNQKRKQQHIRGENKPPIKKIDNNILKGKALPNFQESVNEFFTNLSPNDAMFLTPSELLLSFEEHIVQCAKEVASIQEKSRPDWFSQAEETLVNLIERRNGAFKSFMKNPSTENQQILKTTRRELLKEKRRAKRKWQYEYAEKCQTAHLKINPKETWSMVFKIMEGFQTHHKSEVERFFRFKDGKLAKNADENAEVLKSHFSSLFNSQVEVDNTVLEEIPKHEIQHELGKVPSKAEIRRAISKMANNKAPGKSGLTTDMIKNLPAKAFNLYVEFIQEFWRDNRMDLDSWHVTVLNTLYKGKGDPRDPNNHLE